MIPLGSSSSLHGWELFLNVFWLNAQLRSVFTCNALLLNFYALKYMAIGDALVILSSTPAFAYFFGFLFLGEPVGIVPIVMSLVTLSGVVFIIRPPMLTGGSAMDENTLVGSLSLE